jgi:ParB-like chromosome segregation protein Spo0J
MSSKSKLALLDDSNFPIELIEVGQNIRDVSEKEEGIKELADSIDNYGQLEPIGIEFDENEKGKFKLVYGHRRLIAISKILKWKNVKVVRVSSDNNR